MNWWLVLMWWVSASVILGPIVGRMLARAAAQFPEAK